MLCVIYFWKAHIMNSLNIKFQKFSNDSLGEIKCYRFSFNVYRL